MHRQVNAIAGRLSLRAPQRHSLEILDRITELATLKKGDDPAVALEAIKAAWPSVDDFERQFPSVVGQFKLTHYPERVERDAGLAAPKREAADWVPVSLRTINAWIARNLVQWQYTAGGAVRIWEPSLWRPDQPRRAAPGRPFTAAN